MEQLLAGVYATGLVGVLLGTAFLFAWLDDWGTD